MGYMRHHAIVVTTFQPKAAKAARAKAIELFEDGLVSETLESVINGYLTFLIAPDGSKLGWARDKQGDESREGFIAWLKGHGDHNSTWFDWVEIQYGDDEKEALVVSHSDEEEDND